MKIIAATVGSLTLFYLIFFIINIPPSSKTSKPDHNITCLFWQMARSKDSKQEPNFMTLPFFLHKNFKKRISKSCTLIWTDLHDSLLDQNEAWIFLTIWNLVLRNQRDIWQTEHLRMCKVQRQLDGQTDRWSRHKDHSAWLSVQIQVNTFNKAYRHQTAIQLYMKKLSQNSHIFLMYKCYKTLCNPGKKTT